MIVQTLDGVVWMLDPIDGTMNFIHQKRNFAISLGIYAEGVGMLGYIYDVMRDDFYHAAKDEGAYFNDERLPQLEITPLAEAVIGINASWVAPNRFVDNEKIIELIKKCRGTRSYGSAALELAYVSSGRLDAYMSMRLVAMGCCWRYCYCAGGRCCCNKHERGFSASSWARYIYSRKAWIASRYM